MKPQSELLPSIALIGVILLAALAIVQPFAPKPPEPGPGPMAVSGGDYDSLSFAVSRIFGARVIPRGKDGRSELRVGALPPGMPFTLPVPTGTTVVGSLSNDLPDSAEIIMDSNVKLDELIVIYRESFAAQGFIEPVPAQEPVFQPDGEFGISHSICRSRDDVSVSYVLSPEEDGPTRIWVYANWNSTTVSCLAVDAEGVLGVADRLLPTVKTPAGSVVQELGSGSGTYGGANAYTEVGIELPISAEDLANYIQPQLVDAGWVLTRESVSDYGAWSTWLVRDAEGHPWDGALVIVASPISNHLSVRLEVRRQP